MAFLGITSGMLGSTLLGGLGSALSGVLNLGSNSVNNKQSYKYQKKLMDYQNQLNISNWNMINDYNSPSAQMERYSEAGLNPNLIYGQSNTSSPISSPSPGTSPKQEKLFDFAEGLNVALGAATLKGKELENEALQEDIYTKRKDREEADARISKIRQDIIKIDAEAANAKQTLENLKQDFVLKQDVHDLNEIEKLIKRNEWDISESNVYLKNQDVKYSDALYSCQINIQLANVGLIKAKTAESQAQRSEIIALTSKINQEFEKLKLDNLYYNYDREWHIYLEYVGVQIDRLKALSGNGFIGAARQLLDDIINGFDVSTGQGSFKEFRDEYEKRFPRYGSK